MADRIPPSVLAAVDQGIAECNTRLDHELRLVRRLIAARGRHDALMHITGEYATSGVPITAACTLAVAVVRLAEAEEPR